jgi:hypothetical protein
MNIQQQQQQQQQQPSQAFLALPRRQDQRQIFAQEFLAGGWVRHYAFAQRDVAFLYYSLQPGRYGAIFQSKLPTGNGATKLCTSTIVMDMHSKLVLYVPALASDSGSDTARFGGGAHHQRKHQQPVLVDSDYDEAVSIMSLEEAFKSHGRVIGGICDYVNEIANQKSEGKVPVYVSASYVHDAGAPSVPANTKFVYLRRVFPDPGSSFALFRISNKRSQLICTTQYDFDIRWQKPREAAVQKSAAQKEQSCDLKYYVYRAGNIEPFSMDKTGLLARVQAILEQNFNNQQ